LAKRKRRVKVIRGWKTKRAGFGPWIWVRGGQKIRSKKPNLERKKGAKQRTKGSKGRGGKEYGDFVRRSGPCKKKKPVIPEQRCRATTGRSYQWPVYIKTPKTKRIRYRRRKEEKERERCQNDR